MKTWQADYQNGVTSPEALAQAGLVSDVAGIRAAQQHLDIRIPHELFQRVRENPALARQFVPSNEELIFLPEELNDPIGDEPMSPVAGVTHRYPDRVLLKVTYLCGVYCRFCFRRYKVSHSENNVGDLEQGLHYIASHPEIWEVILTGGDPLIVGDSKLGQWLKRLGDISHVKVVRFHTRIPSVMPSRITPELIDILKASPQAIWMAVHINHPDELTPHSLAAFKRIIDAGIPVVSQSVLLKGINDDRSTLERLFRALVENRVKPYYLHFPDLARGTHHFRLPLSEAIELVGSLRGRLSGLALPQLIVDIPGGYGKIPVDVARATPLEDGSWELQSPLSGERYRYPPHSIK